MFFLTVGQCGVFSPEGSLTALQSADGRGAYFGVEGLFTNLSSSLANKRFTQFNYTEINKSSIAVPTKIGSLEPQESRSNLNLNIGPTGRQRVTSFSFGLT
jgi:hypothetical protein